MRGALALAGVLWIAACAKRDAPQDAPMPEEPAPADGACRQYQTTPRAVGKTPTVLSELSGLAASATHEGIFWAHNDSGNATELFAVRESGEVVATFPLDGAVAEDAEDLALGPCGVGEGATCLYLADVGDNLEMRASVSIIRVREPASLVSTSLAAERFAFHYPGGPRNAESLVIDRKSAALYVITKSAGSLGELYRLDALAAGANPEAVRIGELRSRNNLDHVSTGAALHPTATRLLVRTYSHVWELRKEGATSIEELVNTEAAELPGVSTTAHAQPQSEAITYSADGRSYLFASEGEGSPVLRVDCRE